MPILPFALDTATTAIHSGSPAYRRYEATIADAANTYAAAAGAGAWGLWRSLMAAWRDPASSLLLLNQVVASNLWPAPITLKARDVDPSTLYTEYNLSVPVDHFHNDSMYEPHSNDYFNLRYWYDASHYIEGGPVIVLQSGETDATGRLPYLQKGIVAELAEAVGGLGVILEHRYYGTSFPTADLSTENLRFLTTDQALADQAYFAANIVFPGMEHLNLTAPGTPYIAYGGSYAGAFVAFLRKLYPEYTWGAISSSGVTEACYDYWQYYEPIREYGPPKCIDIHTKLINIADRILLSNDTTAIDTLKATFSLSNLTYNDDFANTIGLGIEYWQSRNWDPEVNDPTFFEYCGNITSPTTIGNDTSTYETNVTSIITAADYSTNMTTAMLNWIDWFNANILSGCDLTSETLDDCFGTHDASADKYTDKSVSNYDNLAWPYQYCTQWGYLQSGSTVPPDRLPLISRLVSIAWNMLVCNFAFDIYTPADTAVINKYGAYNISYPRLAIIGGQADPWRPVTPLADTPLDGSSTDRLLTGDSTVSEPLIVIPGAVHHWDENGVFANETTPDFPPPEIKAAKAQLVAAVEDWMGQWVFYCHTEGRGVCAKPYTGPTGNYSSGGWGDWEVAE